MKKCIDGAGTHTDLAVLIQKKYDGRFVCADIKENKWFEFKQAQHRWVEIDSATTLRNLITTDIRSMF